MIRYYKNLPVKGSLQINVIGDIMDTVPLIISYNTGMQVVFNGVTYRLNVGTNEIDSIIVTEGNNLFTFNGTVKVSIDLVGGRL